MPATDCIMPSRIPVRHFIHPLQYIRVQSLVYIQYMTEMQRETKRVKASKSGHDVMIAGLSEQ